MEGRGSSGLWWRSSRNVGIRSYRFGGSRVNRNIVFKSWGRQGIVIVDSDIPSGSSLQIHAASPSVPTTGPPGTSSVPPALFDIPPCPSDVPTGASTVPTGSPTVPTDVSSRADPTGVSTKGKSLMVEEDIPVIARTFKQMEEDRLGEEATKRLHDEEMAQMERERVEVQRKRQQEKKRQALAEQLFKDRQNRPMNQAQQKAYMRKYVKNQSSDIYNTGWTMAYVKSFTDDQLKQEFVKIHKVQSHSQIQAFSQTLKRPGHMLEEPSSKNPKSPKAPTPSMPEEVLFTPLGEINALYRIDGSTKHFATLRQILHMVD
nr:reverse transcriptase domain-containing protein [Tanacetum cinerariifolium]